MQYTTHYDYPLLDEFFHFNILRTATKKRKLPAVIIFSLIVYVGSAYFLLTSKKFSWLFYTLIGVVLLSDALVLYFWLTITRRAQKSNPALFTAVNDYAFESRHFTVSSVAGNQTETRIVKYEDLRCVAETPRCFYLFMTETSGYIVNKAETTEADAERLAVFLKSKCKLRYYYRKR